MALKWRMQKTYTMSRQPVISFDMHTTYTKPKPCSSLFITQTPIIIIYVIPSFILAIEWDAATDFTLYPFIARISSGFCNRLLLNGVHIIVSYILMCKMGFGLLIFFISFLTFDCKINKLCCVLNKIE